MTFSHSKAPFQLCHYVLDDLGQVPSPLWACFAGCEMRELSQVVFRLYPALIPCALVRTMTPPLPPHPHLENGLEGEKRGRYDQSMGSKGVQEGLSCHGGMAGGTYSMVRPTRGPWQLETVDNLLLPPIETSVPHPPIPLAPALHPLSRRGCRHLLLLSLQL